MKDVTTILQKKLYDILKPVLSCPVYYKYLPATIEPNEYVLINTITNIDAGTIHSSDTDTTIIIGIYTKDSQANPGKTANDIAALVYSNSSVQRGARKRCGSRSADDTQLYFH
jgi:hypothetical protein